MLVSDIGYELAIRLGDPVSPSAPSESGAVFSEEDKLKYISRAYSKLTRMLKILMRDYQPEFNKTRQFGEYDVPAGDTVNAITLESTLDVDEIFVHYYLKGSTTALIKPAAYMEPSKYLSNKYDVNDVKSTSFTEGKFKYTIMSNIDLGKPRLYLLPIPNKTVDGHYYKKVEILYNPDLLNITWDSSLPITNQYTDLLIDLATIQGMQDIARADKAQLIERSISQDWQILGQYGTYMKQTEGVKE